MYERFTDRARKVIHFANLEAQRFNRPYIGTEHILLGLVKEGAGVTANVLKNLDIDLRKIDLEVEKLVPSVPNPVHMGELPHTPRARNVIEYAIEEAVSLEAPDHYVGTEHILLGLVRESEGVAAQVLMNLGLELDQVRAEVLKVAGVDATEVERRRLHVSLQSARSPVRSSRKPPVLDLPARAKQEVEELDAQIARFLAEKEEAMDEQDFEKAAHLRDQADKAKKSKERLVHAWLLAEFPVDPSWLTWNDGTVPRIARMIADLKRWENLPLLADVLKQAGCTNDEVLEHCRQPGEHGDRCWVIDLLLKKRAQ